jgi:hypothetical protein
MKEGYRVETEHGTPLFVDVTGTTACLGRLLGVDGKAGVVVG